MRLVRFDGEFGTILVNPKHVSVVSRDGNGFYITMSDGMDWRVDAESVDEIAEKLELGANLP